MFRLFGCHWLFVLEIAVHRQHPLDGRSPDLSSAGYHQSADPEADSQPECPRNTASRMASAQNINMICRWSLPPHISAPSPKPSVQTIQLAGNCTSPIPQKRRHPSADCSFPTHYSTARLSQVGRKSRNLALILQDCPPSLCLSIAERE